MIQTLKKFLVKCVLPVALLVAKEKLAEKYPRVGRAIDASAKKGEAQ